MDSGEQDCMDYWNFKHHYDAANSSEGNTEDYIDIVETSSYKMHLDKHMR